MKYLSVIMLLMVSLINNNIYAQKTVSDYDGNIYPTIEIGNQLWMAKNLTVSHYSNGEEIRSFCYNHDSSNCEKYGRLYPWTSLVGGIDSDSLLGICPDGWHVPTHNDWQILIDILGGPVNAGALLRRSRNTNFNLQWGGNHQSKLDLFSFIDRKTYLWSSSKYSNTAAWMIMTGINTKNVNMSTVPKEFSFSVRCVKTQ